MLKRSLFAAAIALVCSGASALGGAPIAGGYVPYANIPVSNWDNLAVGNCNRLEPWANCLNTLVNRSTAGLSLSGAQTISSPGTYTMNAQSSSSATPVVNITTNGSVLITGSVLVGAGVIISNPGGASVELANSQEFGTGLVPAQLYNSAAAGSYLKIHDNVSSNLWGIFVNGSNGTAVVSIYSNVGYNMTNASGSLAHFIQLANGVFPGAQIYNNTVIDAPYKSSVNDVINLYRAVGTSSNPIQVYGNHILGAYSADPGSPTGFSGCGIITDGSSSDSASNATQYVNIYNNKVFDTTNCGIGLAAGNNNQAYSNLIVSSGVIGGSTVVHAQNVGAYVSNQSGQTTSAFFQNNSFNNRLYWLNANTNSVNDFFPGYTVPSGCNPAYGGGCTNIDISLTTNTIAGGLALEASYLHPYFGTY